jgi:type III pantothenate kinase
MVLVVDIGNTHLVFGIYEGEVLVVDWRLKTDPHRTSDEYGALLQILFTAEGISFDAIKGIIISCVVPPMISTIERLCNRFFHIDPIVVGPTIDMGMRICYKNPLELGVDRIVNSVGAFEKYRQSLIVIDFGTATTFDYISPLGEFVGGAIAPGITISSEALFQRTSKLPKVDLVYPERVVATTTVESIQAGIVFGYISLVDGIVQRIKDEVQTAPFVVATGGLALLISAHTKTIDEVDEFLTLRGLKILFDRNSKKNSTK